MNEDEVDSGAGAAYVFTVDVPPSPRLTIPLDIPGVVDEPVEVPVTLDTATLTLTGTSFSIDYDTVCLDLDPTDADFDGIPDAVRLYVPSSFGTSVFFDLGDVDGEIDVGILDPFRVATLADGLLATVTFTPTCTPMLSQTVTAPVIFSTDPAATFFNSEGQEIPGDTESGSVVIHAVAPAELPFADGFESGDVSSWSAAQPWSF